MNIGLVLSGGMAKGAYQIGALKALSNFVPLEEIKYISAASVGVLNGYAYATNNIENAETMWKNICQEDSKSLISKILKSTMLQQNIKGLYSPEQKMSADFYCSLLNITNRTIDYKNLLSVEKSDVPNFLKASVAMPIYNKSVQIDNISYYDGAMIDNIPVFPLLKHNLDYIICIYFDDTCYKFENSFFDNRIIKITFPSKNMLKQSIVFSKDGIDDMINEGYLKATQILRTIFSQGYDNLEYIYNVIDYMNLTSDKRSLRITGDVLVTNFNKFTQKFTKRKIVV